MNTETYIANMQLSSQWGPFLFSLTHEMESQLDQKTLRSLMFNTGDRMGRDFPEPPDHSLESIESLINDVWNECNWGWVKLVDGGDCIRIEHYFSPLYTTFASNSASWAGEMLRGFYSAVFEQLGAGNELHVRRTKSDSTDHLEVLELCRIE